MGMLGKLCIPLFLGAALLTAPLCVSAQDKVDKSIKAGSSAVMSKGYTLRDVPEKKFTAVTDADKGSTVKVVEIQDRWAKVELDGKAGWMPLRLLKKAGKGEDDGAVADADEKPAKNKKKKKKGKKGGDDDAAAADSGPAIETGNAVLKKAYKLRSTTTKKYEVTGKAKKGESVTLVSTEGKWAKVRRSNGEEGYLPARLVEQKEGAGDQTPAASPALVEEKKPEPAAASAVLAEGGQARVRYRFELRSTNQKDFKVTGNANEGVLATVVKLGKNWAQIRTRDGAEGWIPLTYIEAAAGEPAPPPAAFQEESATAAAPKSDAPKPEAAVNMEETPSAKPTSDDLSASSGFEREGVSGSVGKSLRGPVDKPVSTWVWVTGGLAIAGAGVGSVFALNNELKKVEGKDNPNSSRDNAIAMGGFAAAGVFGLTSLVLYLTDPGDSRAESASTPLQVSPMITGSGGGIGVAGGF
ncbi:MAG: hypothetical protein GMKNLPBB_01609 [Myxococcota bacterium]|nr:hypothetical protein [Myxococcota bacterium]